MWGVYINSINMVFRNKKINIMLNVRIKRVYFFFEWVYILFKVDKFIFMLLKNKIFIFKKKGRV